MLLFGGKMKGMNDYDHELNYILFQYRSLAKRKAIKPFLTLMRGLKYNNQQVDLQSLQNEGQITPLSFLQKYIENGPNADRFYNRQQTEKTDSSPIKKFMSENQDFFDQQLSEMANKFGLFQVEQQDNVENTVSQQKQESQQVQNDNKTLLKLSQNDNIILSPNVNNKQLQEFKYFIKKAIYDQNLKLNLDIHARTLSEQKQKELNQHTGAWSDLRSDSSKHNTTQSERKLKNNDSSPQSKQTDDNTQKIGRQVFFQKNNQMQESIDLVRESNYKNIGSQQQVDWNRVIKRENDQEQECQIDNIALQKDNETKYLQTIKQSQNEFYQNQLKFNGFSTKRSNNKAKVIKNMLKIDKLMNQDIRPDQNQTQFNQHSQSHSKLSLDQHHSIESAHQNRINRLYNHPKQQQTSVHTFFKNKTQLELPQINYQSNNFSPNNHKTNNYIIGYARTYRPSSFLPQNIHKRCQTQQVQLHYNQDKCTIENHQLSTRRKEIDLRFTNNYNQQIQKLQQSDKNILKNNQQYGKKSKGPQILRGVSYVHSFKKQKQKDDKQKIQIPKAKNKMPNLGSQRQQNSIYEVIKLKDSAQKQSNEEIKKNNTQNINQEQQQVVIRSQPLKRPAKNQNIIKSASYLEHSPHLPQQNGIIEPKQSSQIKAKSISGTKSDQYQTLLKMIGGSDHLKELSSLVIQPKQLCFQTDKQQLAHFMAVNNISIKSEPSYDQSQDVSMNSSTFRFTPNNLTSFNLEDALKQDSKGVSFNELSQKQRKQLNKNPKTYLDGYVKEYGVDGYSIQGTEQLEMNWYEESETYQPLFVSYKRFNNNIDQLEMPIIQQIQSNKITSNSASNPKVQLKTFQDYRNHFNPKRALSRMKQQQRGVSQFKTQNVSNHNKQYHSVSRSKRIQGGLEGVKKRWQKNGLRFKTKMYNS